MKITAFASILLSILQFTAVAQTTYTRTNGEYQKNISATQNISVINYSAVAEDPYPYTEQQLSTFLVDAVVKYCVESARGKNSEADTTFLYIVNTAPMVEKEAVFNATLIGEKLSEGKRGDTNVTEIKWLEVDLFTIQVPGAVISVKDIEDEITDQLESHDEYSEKAEKILKDLLLMLGDSYWVFDIKRDSTKHPMVPFDCDPCINKVLKENGGTELVPSEKINSRED